jgi:hypothetical protein
MDVVKGDYRIKKLRTLTLDIAATRRLGLPLVTSAVFVKAKYLGKTCPRLEGVPEMPLLPLLG